MNARLSLAASVIAISLAASTAHATDKEECAGAAEQDQRLRAEKKLRQSRDQLVKCGRDVCPSVIRNDCLKWLRDVDSALPSVIFRVRDDNDKDLIKVTVLVDGQVFASSLDGTSVSVDIGPHTFRYEADGMQPYEEQLLISQGEKDRALKVKLVPINKPTAAPVMHDTPQPTTPASAATNTGGSNTGAWVVGGIGVAGLLTFAVLEGIGQSGYSSLKSGCGATAAKCADSEISPVQTELVVALVALGVGVVGLGVSAILFATGHPSAARTAQNARLSLSF